MDYELYPFSPFLLGISKNLRFNAGGATFANGQVGLSSLLLGQCGRTGRISLRDFYLRRALRILPPTPHTRHYQYPLVLATKVPYNFIMILTCALLSFYFAQRLALRFRKSKVPIPMAISPEVAE